MSRYFWDVIECLGQVELKQRLNEGQKKGMLEHTITFCGLGRAENEAKSIKMLQQPEVVPIFVLSARFTSTGEEDGVGFSRKVARA